MKIEKVGDRKVENFGRRNAIKISCKDLLKMLNAVSNSDLKVGGVFSYDNNIIAVTDEDEFTLIVPGTGIKSLDRIVDKVIIPEYRLLDLNPNEDEFTFELVDKPEKFEDSNKKLYYPYIYYDFLNELSPSYFENKDKIIKVEVKGLVTETYYIEGWKCWIDALEFDPLEQDYYMSQIEKALAILVKKSKLDNNNQSADVNPKN